MRWRERGPQLVLTWIWNDLPVEAKGLALGETDDEGSNEGDAHGGPEEL